ncbi:MAG: 50S ribosomal protein L30e [Candidatus Aenigmarchaeota archaeon]|nr:50S ribosomal protein L30e [Candidatus Aenigmarchaeota archaeon]MBU5688862.1 50S ribosomal protein L30e [Candidatus Aenigmarchaeota archaeon]
MSLVNLIQEKVKANEVVLGYNRVIKMLKSGKPKMIIIANNLPKDKKETILHNAKLAKVEVKEFDNDNVNLGLVCGKPFSVSVLAIKGSDK